MNKIEFLMDKYFNGLNNNKLNNYLNTYGKLIEIVDEECLTSLANEIADELNVLYEDERAEILLGFLNDYVNGEISKRTLYHCIIGACDRYSEDLPEHVLRVSHLVYRDVYDNLEADEHECDCANCTNCDCPNSGAEVAKEYDIPSIVRAIVDGKSEIIIDGEKVPYQVVLMVAELMDTTGLNEEGILVALKHGMFDGKIVEKVNKEELEEELEDDARVDEEMVKRVIDEVEEDNPGLHALVRMCRDFMDKLGINIDKQVIETVVERAKKDGLEVSEEEVSKIYKLIVGDK